MFIMWRCFLNTVGSASPKRCWHWLKRSHTSVEPANSHLKCFRAMVGPSNCIAESDSPTTNLTQPWVRLNFCKSGFVSRKSRVNEEVSQGLSFSYNKKSANSIEFPL